MKHVVMFTEVSASERVEILFRKSRTEWLTEKELKELIEIRNNNNKSWFAEMVSHIINDQHDKLCGIKHW